jgi:hypothetical protein
MATLDEFVMSFDLDDEEQEPHTDLDIDWTFLSLNDIGNVTFSTEPVDNKFLQQTKVEIKRVCQNTRRLLNKRTNRSISFSDVSNYFLKAVLPGKCFGFTFMFYILTIGRFFSSCY